MDSSQFITNDNIVLVEAIKGIVSLGTIVLFTRRIQSSGDKRSSDLLFIEIYYRCQR
jgi:L-lactate utilization protein LutC